MKSEWKKLKIGDVCTIKHGYAFKGVHFCDEKTEHIVTTPGNFAISGGFKLDKPKYYRGPIPQDYILSPGDIIVTMTDLSKDGDTLGYAAIVPESNDALFLHNQRIGLIENISDSIDKGFLYWLMRTYHYQKYIVNHASGSTVKHTSPSSIASYSFQAPPLPIQRKIASILSALDEKIETNNAICRNLEEQARALYELWLSKRKNECEWLSLEAIADLNPEAYSIKEKWGYINYLDTGNITDGVISSIQKIDLYQDELPSRARRKVKAGDVVFSTVRPNQRHFGILHSPLPNMLVSTGFTVIRSNKTDISNELIYLLLSDSSFVEKMQQIGEQSVSAYPSVKPTDIATCQIPFMDSMDYFQMQKVICAMFSQSAVLKDVNRYLSDMRDTLLPKLMNGEIDLGKLGKLA